MAAVLTISVIACLLFFGCVSDSEAQGISEPEEKAVIKMSDGSEISDGDIAEFVYTFDHIGYNAEYQRFRFYTENGKHMFFHERREIRGDYGFASEKDVTRKGDFQLKQNEWQSFCSFLQNGEIRQRNDEPVDGDDGPWMYIYLKNSDSRGQEFYFADLQTRGSFEDFCESLAKKKR